VTYSLKLIGCVVVRASGFVYVHYVWKLVQRLEGFEAKMFYLELYHTLFYHQTLFVDCIRTVLEGSSRDPTAFADDSSRLSYYVLFPLVVHSTW
jgi:hypothetical protein